MGLRCLLGHDFGEAEIEREREEEGNEMVVTIREVETCERCGTERVLSENKEVTSIRTPSEVGFGGESGGSDAGEGEDGAVAPSTGGGVEFGGADDDDRGAEDAAALVEDAEEDEPFEPPQSAEEDDGIILEDESPSEARAGGRRERDPEPDAELDNPSTDVDVTADAIESEEADDDAEFIDAEEAAEDASDDGPVPWPEHDDVAVEEREPVEHEWPSPAGDDEGFDAEPSDGSPVDVSFGGSLTPGANGAVDDAGAENGEAVFLEPDDSGASGEGTVEIERPAPDAETEYYCPNCETTWPASQSSTRAGDICRECRRGYIGERRL